MQKSGFFNALLSNGEYDRKYNANDYCDNLAVVISNGVLRGVDDDLKVTATGMLVTVGVGRAWIEGHYYLNDTSYTFAAPTAPIGGTRYDRVFLRLNKNLAVRSISLVYQQGTASNSPVKPAPVREGNIYDLVLADIHVGTNATSVTVTDTRGDANICGWVYSTSGDNSFFTSLDNAFNTWFVDKKDTLATVTTEVQYKQRTTLAAAGKTVQITIPQYDASINQKLDVYVNGIRQYSPNNYTVTGATITFAGNLIAGTEVTVYITVSKDGSGIPSVIDDVTELQQRVDNLENGLFEATFTYFCNGVDDNVKISRIAHNFVTGGDDYGVLTISVYGTFGATAPMQGAGTSASPYLWFIAGRSSVATRRVYIDFGNCSQITLPQGEAEKYYVVFYGLETNILNCNIIANGSDAYINMFSSPGGTLNFCENCRFWITTRAGYISRGGTFRNCRVSLTTTGEDAYVFNVLSGGLLRVFGGEYYAYAPTSNNSMIVYVNSAQTNAVVITYGMNCPKNERSGYVQTFAINCLTQSALCSFTDTITTLGITAPQQNIRGTLSVNKPNLM